VTQVKEFNTFKCVFEHDQNRSILVIEYYFKTGRLFYRSCMQNMKDYLVKPFIEGFDELCARDVYNLNMEIL